MVIAEDSPVIKDIHHTDLELLKLHVIETFHSIQGESSFAGWPTTFLRLAGCNLRCTWCDTTYSFGRGATFSLADLLDVVRHNKTPYVCITGGEPLLQANVYPLLKILCEQEYRVSLETGGSLPIDPVDERVRVILDIKCPSSGMEEKNFWPNLKHLRSHDEVKFVLSDREDYMYAQAICERYHLFEKKNVIHFSPVHETLCPKTLAEWVLHDALPVHLNLQIHKYIWPAETRGV